MPVTYQIDPRRRTVETVASGLVPTRISRDRSARRSRTTRSDSPGALAIVTDSDFAFGMARMYQILAEPLPVQIGVFRTLDDATTW